jgi:hypothetical protein
MLEAHAVSEEMQWLLTKEWPQDGERKWDDDHKDNINGLDHEVTGRTLYRQCCTGPSSENYDRDVSQGKIADP